MVSPKLKPRLPGREHVLLPVREGNQTTSERKAKLAWATKRAAAGNGPLGVLFGRDPPPRHNCWRFDVHGVGVGFSLGSLPSQVAVLTSFDSFSCRDVGRVCVGVETCQDGLVGDGAASGHRHLRLEGNLSAGTCTVPDSCTTGESERKK